MSVKIDWPAVQRDFEKSYLHETTPLSYDIRRDWRNKALLLVEFNTRIRNENGALFAPDALSPRLVNLIKIRAYRFGQGHGGEALEWLKDGAASRGLCIALKVLPTKPHKDDPLGSFNNLKKWYERKEFVFEPLSGMHEHLLYNY